MGWACESGHKSDNCRLQKAGMALKKTAGDTFAHRIYATFVDEVMRRGLPRECSVRVDVLSGKGRGTFVGLQRGH